MINLLNAGLFKLSRSKMFFIIALMVLGIALVIFLNNASNNLQNVSLNNMSLNSIILMGLFMAMFSSLFLGEEFTYGTIRNKIIMGHSRIKIYMSNLIISIITGIIFETIYIVATLILGSFVGIDMHITIYEYSVLLLKTFMVIIAFSSLYNFITLISSEVTIATAICMIVFIIMFVVCNALYSVISTNKYMTTIIMDENGKLQKLEDKENLNPNYPGETKIRIAKIIFYSIPEGAAMSILDFENEDNSYFIICSLSNIIIINLLGMMIFQKKNFK